MEDIKTDSKLHPEELSMNHIILPRMVDLTVRVIESCGREAGVTPDLLESILSDLCFAMPHDAKGCSRLLSSLPENSSVWDKLEEGILNNKDLPVDITVTLYTHRPSAMETEMLRILNQYAEAVYEGDWCNDASLGIAHFKSHGEPLEESQSLKRKRDQSPGHTNSDSNSKNNLWGASSVVLAAARSHSVFSQCLKFLFKVAVQSSFSLNFVFGCRDFFAELLGNLDGELYALFPTDIQHLVYLLSLPITSVKGRKYFETYANSHVIQSALVEALQEGSEVATTVRALLCCFPYWLPILNRDRLLHEHLR